MLASYPTTVDLFIYSFFHLVILRRLLPLTGVYVCQTFILAVEKLNLTRGQRFDKCPQNGNAKAVINNFPIYLFDWKKIVH